MKRHLSLALALAMVVGLSACGTAPQPSSSPGTPPSSPPSATPSAYTAGSYQATVPGMKGELTVSVTVDEQSITAVEVLSHEETTGIGTVAIDAVTKAIVDGQTLAVDAVAGATVTRAAVLSGASNALEQAGADLAALKVAPEAAPLKQGAEESYDIVIVGAGGAGLTAAIESAKDNGAKVLVLEKLAYIGGSTRVSGGAIWMTDTQYNESYGVSFTAEELISFMESRASKELNRPLLTQVANVSGTTISYLMENGMPLDPALAGLGHSASPLMTLAPTDNSGGKGGAQVADFLYELAEKNGAEVRLSSKVTSLLVEDGTVAGVNVETTTDAYTVRAKKVILATGGFTQNEELIKELTPDYTNNIPFTGAGSTGDGILMTRELDTVIVGDGMMCLKGLNRNLGYYGAIGGLCNHARVLVNKEGTRFMNERAFYSEFGEPLNAQTDKLVYGIVDSQSTKLEQLDQAVTDGIVYKADTLDALADAIDVDKAAFLSTMDGYVATKTSGKDDADFGVANDEMADISKAPYYAIPVRPLFIGSIPGLQVDERTQVLNSAGAAIPNLYACGELTFGNLFSRWYPASGSGVGFALYTGAIAGEAARAAMDAN